MNFIKKHPSFIVAILGIAAILLSVLMPWFSGYGFILFYLIYGLLTYFRFTSVLLIGLNVAAMIAVLKNKSAAGVITSFLSGGFGAIIGTLFNQSYECKKAVKVIFSIQMWILIWAYVSFMLIEWGYHTIGVLN
ncbi:MAG: hypothetical protein HDT25_02720 [Ruminococcus sp.]|nr:hypothetical protein [Ruminococcus sp.]